MLNRYPVCSVHCGQPQAVHFSKVLRANFGSLKDVLVWVTHSYIYGAP